MKTIFRKLALGLLLLPIAAIAACPNFLPGQLSASALNNAFAAPCITAGTINGSVISGTPISGASGAFTTLSASSTLTASSGVNVTGTLAGNTINAANGVNASGAYSAAYTDGTVVDYSTGNGRISVGTADTLSFYTGGIANTQMVQMSASGISVTTPTTATHAVQLQQVSLYPTVASATTINIFGAAGATINVSGTTTVTGITAATAAQVGSIKTIIPSNAAGFSITASASLVVDGATTGTYLMPQNANIQIIATSTTTFNVTTIFASGTWTPNQGAGLTVVGAFSSSGKWIKKGNTVSYTATLSGATSIAVNSGGIISTNFPFTVSGNSIGVLTNGTTNITGSIIISNGTAQINSNTTVTANSSIIFNGIAFL